MNLADRLRELLILACSGFWLGRQNGGTAGR